MILNGIILGYSIFSDINFIPSKTSYNSILINGNCMLDKIRILDKELTEEEIDNLTLADIYTWNPNTLLYSEFSNNLSAGNVTNITNPITQWLIYRRTTDDTIYDKLATLDVVNKSYIDYTVKANRNYQYRVYGKNSAEISDPITTDNLKTDFFSWSLTDASDGTTYLFDLNLKSGTIQSNTDMNVFDGIYTQFPSISFSDKDYLSGTIQCLAGTISSTTGELIYPIDYLDNLRAFINNKRVKILKDRRGMAIEVCTNNFNYSFIDEVKEQVANISFDYIQKSTI